MTNKCGYHLSPEPWHLIIHRATLSPQPWPEGQSLIRALLNIFIVLETCFLLRPWSSCKFLGFNFRNNVEGFLLHLLLQGNIKMDKTIYGMYTDKL